MHDGTLISVQCDWKTGRTALSFRSNKGVLSLIAEGVADLHVPRRHGWGPSVSVNKVTGPSEIDGGLQEIKIEMQSGDCIRIVAASICMPTV
jgi:hypothetical protein